MKRFLSILGITSLLAFALCTQLVELSPLSTLLWDGSALTSSFVSLGIIFRPSMSRPILPPQPSYLTFIAQSQNVEIEITSSNGTLSPSLQYSLDEGETWNDYSLDISITLEHRGDKVMFRGVNPHGLSQESDYVYINSSGLMSASGDITSLINGVGGDIRLPRYCFYRLFYENESLVSAPNFPSTILGEYCYAEMFYGCTNLDSVESFSAITLAPYCCQGMFSHCSSLTYIPALPAKTLAIGCYKNMFSVCDSLDTIELLPAQILVSQCYEEMFSRCSSLNNVTALFLTEPGDSYTKNWLSDVADFGIFTRHSDAAWHVEGANGVPEGWQVVTQ